MRTRRRGHSLRLDGPGRVRVKLAEIIERELGCQCDPYDIWQNNTPSAKWLDLARWGVTCRFPDGATKNIHSWDTMTAIVKHGLAVVSDDGEVCRK